MKYLIPFLCLAFLSLTSSKCKEDLPTTPTGTVALNIKAQFNGSPLVMNQVYDYSGKKLRITKLSFYISPISFSNSSNSGTTATQDILKADFTNIDTDAQATAGLNLSASYGVGSYTNITTGAGISAALNAKKPKDFASNNPLSNTGDYWDAWSSYIFTKFEGSLDKDGDGKFETGITIHTGGNEVYQSLNFSKNFTVTEGGTTTLNFDLNTNQLLDGIDLVTVNSTHQTGDLPTMKRFTGNFTKALVLKQ